MANRLRFPLAMCALALIPQAGEASGQSQPEAAPSVSIPASTASTSSMPRVWAGHQVALGSRRVPVLGELPTRTDTLVLARLSRTSKGWRLVEEACDVRFQPVGRVTVSMEVDGLPKSVTELTERDGKLRARSRVAWGSEDIDGDGHPGVTVDVDASICAGSLYVANESTSTGSARFGTRFLGGHVQTTIRQKILGAEGICLGAMADDSTEEVAGPIAYVPVDDDATCESLLQNGDWPVDAMPND